MHSASIPPQAVDSARRRRLWAVTLVAMVVPLAATLLFFVAFRESAAAQPLYILAKAFEVVWPLFAALFLIGRRPGIRDHPLAHHLRALPLGIGTGLAIVAVMALWMASPLGAWIDRAAPAVAAKVASLGFRDHFIAFAVFVAVVHSLMEEYLWRWFVFGNLRLLIPGPRAHILAAVAFAAHHLVITSQFFPFPLAAFLAFCVAIGGLLWSWLYQHQQSLAGAWACHLVVDVGLMVVGWHLLQL